MINPLEPKTWDEGGSPQDKDAPLAFRQATKLSQHISFLKDFFRCYKDFDDRHIDVIEIMLGKLYTKWSISDSTNFSRLESIDYPILSDLYTLMEEEYKGYDKAKYQLYTVELLQEILLGLHSMCQGAESKFFNGHTNITYDTYSVRDNENRKWKFVSDSSISCQKKVGNRKQIADREYSVELVSPICKYEDIEKIQEMVRKLREAGAFSNKSCGIHIHINAAPFEAYQLRNLVNIVAAKENMIYKALQVDSDRERRYCKKIDTDFLEKLNKQKPKTKSGIQKLWYKGSDGSHQHYHDSRYHCLNLHSVFQKGTIEFRAFNGSLHAGKMKAYLQFCMAITAQAYNQRSASPIKTVSENEKYTFRVWLLRLGLIGDEFKTARKHLLDHLEGNIAWKSPEQAEAQKERLRKKREVELSDSQEETIETQNNDMEIDEQEEETPAFTMSMNQ